MAVGGYMGKILRVDLSTRKVSSVKVGLTDKPQPHGVAIKK